MEAGDTADFRPLGKPALGHAFLPYAVPTIDGELKRHLRDHVWHVHVPRRMQEKHRRVRRAQGELRRAGHAQGGSPRELQRLTGITEEDARLALLVDKARSLASLDEQQGPEGGAPLADILGADDPALEDVTDRVALRALIRKLPERERVILYLYFFSGLTQRHIAVAVGLSQMHVSRLLRCACALLRQGLASC